MELAADPELSSLLSEADGVYKLRSRVRCDIRLVQKELGSLQVALSKIAEVPAYELDERTKARAADLRNLYFQIQHDVDNLRDRIRAHRSRMADLQGLKGFATRIIFKIASIWAGREFATSIREMKRRLQDSADRHVSNAMSEVKGPHLDTEDLVGIDCHRERLVNILTEDGATSSQQLKVVAIVGDGPLGKTTLAKVVYDNIAPQFDLKAWVTVSNRSDIINILRSMLQQITQDDQHGDFEEMDPKQLIDKIRKTLKVKRYLIVVDNILDEPECELLKCALIDNNYGSAVLMTSRKRGHIAYFVGSVHELQPLSDVDSRKLLYKRLFGSEDKWPSSELGEIYEKFLERCDGMPSTIITMSRLLADKRSMTRDELYAFYASIYSGLLFDQTIGHDLPHLKTCLLYLSLFPKGCEVNGEHLIWKWLAEGFIHEKESEGRTSQELGGLYLKELLKRDLIQPVDVDADGRVLYWTVKDHELMIAMSTQENFVTVLSSHVQGRAISSMVKRLSIQGSNVEHQQLEGHLSQVKSLVVSGDTNWIPSLSVLQDLRVLDLGGSQSLQNDDIKDIGSLFHLKCLIIGGKYITHIPEKVGDLLFLETLDLRESGVIELPERIFQIKQLKRLYVNSSTNIPQGIGKLEALLELGDIKISEPNFLKELHNLTKLRILRIAIWSWEDEKLHTYHQQLLENLHSLVQVRQNIQSLSILTCCSIDFMDTPVPDSQWAPPSLKKLEIRHGAFDKLPKWIDSLHVSSLSIEVNELSQDMINVLGKLDNLCFLSLTSKHHPKGKFGLDTDGFKKLEGLQLVSNVMAKMFEPLPDAMQKLRRLKLRFQASLTKDVNHGFSFGLEDLSTLDHLHVEIICFNASHRVVGEAEAAIQGAISCHSGRPNLEIKRVRQENMTNSDEVLDNAQQKPEKEMNNKRSSRKVRVTAKKFRPKKKGVARKYKIVSLQLESHILTLRAL
ncbi:disease resistance protein Pik-2-like isoform X1 [Miscanthus floridulus]|uniref:disease resistance protein Pik-2-like isoform X1 n=1 Tax=Miscanthus floridulus TaxID=154761 RepID=UPI0034587D45